MTVAIRNINGSEYDSYLPDWLKASNINYLSEMSNDARIALQLWCYEHARSTGKSSLEVTTCAITHLIRRSWATQITVSDVLRATIRTRRDLARRF